MKLRLFFLFFLFPFTTLLDSCCDWNQEPWISNRNILNVSAETNGDIKTQTEFSKASITLKIEDKITYFGFSNSCAYACSPIEEIHLQNPLDSVSITLNKNYGSIKAGQSFIENLRFSHNNEPAFINEIINLINDESSSFINFKLINPPHQTDTFQFSFVFKDKNDSLFIAKSKPIIISP
jgi:hypothetical protein